MRPRWRALSTRPGDDVDELLRRLRRAAVEPSRVYCGSDWNPERQPVVEIPDPAGEKWYGPGRGWWFYRGEVDPTLRRAIQKWGVVQRHDLTPFLGMLNSAPGNPIQLGPPTIHTYPPHPLFPKDYTVPVIYTGDTGFLSATAVLHALRRYGEEGTWEMVEKGRVARYAIGGESVALIRVFEPQAIEPAA